MPVIFQHLRVPRLLDEREQRAQRLLGPVHHVLVAQLQVVAPAVLVLQQLAPRPHRLGPVRGRLGGVARVGQRLAGHAVRPVHAQQGADHVPSVADDVHQRALGEHEVQVREKEDVVRGFLGHPRLARFQAITVQQFADHAGELPVHLCRRDVITLQHRPVGRLKLLPQLCQGGDHLQLRAAGDSGVGVQDHPQQGGPRPPRPAEEDGRLGDLRVKREVADARSLLLRNCPMGPVRQLEN